MAVGAGETEPPVEYSGTDKFIEKSINKRASLGFVPFEGRSDNTRVHDSRTANGIERPLVLEKPSNVKQDNTLFEFVNNLAKVRVRAAKRLIPAGGTPGGATHTLKSPVMPEWDYAKLMEIMDLMEAV